MSQKHVFSAEETARGVQASKSTRSLKAQRRIEREAMQNDLLMGLTGDVKEIVVEVIRAANSNPVIGVLVAIIAVDALYRIRIIGAHTVVALYAFLGLIEGGAVLTNLIDAAGNFIGDIGSLIPSIGSKTINQASQADLVTPSGTTLVWNQTASGAIQGETSSLMSLLTRLKSK